MKNIQPRIIINSIFLILFFINFSKISCKIFSASEMKAVCSKSDDYINTFFATDQTLNEQYRDYTPLKNFDTKEDYILKMLYLNNGGEKEYKSRKLKQFGVLNHVSNFLLVISIFVIIDLDLHFLFLNSTSEDTDNRISISHYFKISSFAWVRYLIYNTEKMNEFYSKYKRKELPKINKFFKLFLLFISNILLLLSIFYSIFNYKDFEKSEKATNNSTCALMKLIYEIKNGPFREKNNFIGIDLIKSFYDNFDLVGGSIEKNLKTFNESYSFALKLTSQWDEFINELDKNLPDTNIGLVINSYPSEIDKEDNIEKYEQSVFQLQVIYDYYPSNDETKYLNLIDSYMHNKIDPINKLITELNNIFIPNSKIITLNSNTEVVFKNVVQKFYKIFDIYINKFTDVFLTTVYDEFLDNYLSFLFYIDFSNIVFLAFCTILFIPLIGYSYHKKWMENKISLIILFFNSLFILVILSIVSNIKIISMKNKITYVDDLSKALYFLLSKENQEYLIENKDFIINNMDYSIKDIDDTPKSIFYYLNHIINSEKRITELYELSFADLDNKQIDTIYNKTENINFMNLSISNKYIGEYSKKLEEIKNEGFNAYIHFHDLTGIGFQGSGKECPANYLTNINSITKYNKTKKYLSEFNCNEFWDIGTKNIDKYIYKNRKNIANNHYSGREELNPPLLNYLEFSLEEIIERYSDLKKNNSKIYYGIINQFKALENFRENNITNEQITKINKYNDELNKSNNDIFNIMKQNMELTKNIIDSYKNIFNGYASDYKYSSFLDCTFIKTDINFVFSEIEESFVFTINKFYIKHLLVNIINYILAVILVLYYSLIAYEIPLVKAKIKTVIKSNSNMNVHSLLEQKQKIDKNNRGPLIIGTNIGGNVSIVKGGTTINYNNVKPKYNTIHFGENKDIFNINDLMSLNKEVESKIETINKMRTKENRGSQFTINNEERNEVDSSKMGIIEQNNNKTNQVLSKFNDNNK